MPAGGSAGQVDLLNDRVDQEKCTNPNTGRRVPEEQRELWSDY